MPSRDTEQDWWLPGKPRLEASKMESPPTQAGVLLLSGVRWKHCLNDNRGLGDELKREFSYFSCKKQKSPRHFSRCCKRTSTSPLWVSWCPAFVNTADDSSSDL